MVFLQSLPPDAVQLLNQGDRGFLLLVLFLVLSTLAGLVGGILLTFRFFKQTDVAADRQRDVDTATTGAEREKALIQAISGSTDAILKIHEEIQTGNRDFNEHAREDAANMGRIKETMDRLLFGEKSNEPSTATHIEPPCSSGGTGEAPTVANSGSSGAPAGN